MFYAQSARTVVSLSGRIIFCQHTIYVKNMYMLCIKDLISANNMCSPHFFFLMYMSGMVLTQTMLTHPISLFLPIDVYTRCGPVTISVITVNNMSNQIWNVERLAPGLSVIRVLFNWLGAHSVTSTSSWEHWMWCSTEQLLLSRAGHSSVGLLPVLVLQYRIWLKFTYIIKTCFSQSAAQDLSNACKLCHKLVTHRFCHKVPVLLWCRHDSAAKKEQ